MLNADKSDVETEYRAFFCKKLRQKIAKKGEFAADYTACAATETNKNHILHANRRAFERRGIGEILDAQKPPTAANDRRSTYNIQKPWLYA